MFNGMYSIYFFWLLPPNIDRWHKAAVTPVRYQWGYCSLALSHRDGGVTASKTSHRRVMEFSFRNISRDKIDANKFKFSKLLDNHFQKYSIIIIIKFYN